MAEYLAVKEVASLLKVAELTIFRWIRRGYIHPVKIGHTLRFEKAKLLLDVEQHQSKPMDTEINTPEMG